MDTTDSLVDEIVRTLDQQACRAYRRQSIECGDASDRFRGLRGFYRDAEADILASPANEWAIDPYEVDWLRVFTPIERALWHDIRAAGAVMYPQFPVGRYFVDFGNPAAKVAIECDGAFHRHQAGADAQRQNEIERAGWTVYRLTGRECFDAGTHIEDEQRTQRNGESAGQRLLQFITSVHPIAVRRPAWEQ